MARILVIEDAEPLRKDIIEMLTYEGFEVTGAENGAAGVDIARRYHPDLIICDIMMPELNGYDVLDILREDGTTAAIPFIFLTAKTERADMRYGMGIGADDYVTKPFQAAELLGTIRARLHRRKLWDDHVDMTVHDMTENIITNLPHEMRTPLNTIIGFSNMIATEANRLKPSQVTEWAVYIHESSLRLYRLVENYLTYVRVETLSHDHLRQQAMREKTSDPGSITQFQAMLKAQEYQREADLVIHLEDSMQRIHIADQDLGKIVEEIVDNAFKFSKPGTPVTVETQIKDGRYMIRVSDQGRGMTAAQRDSVRALVQFERFVNEQQGSGLGLIIAIRLTELYGGELILDGEEGVGTSVTVDLPA